FDAELTPDGGDPITVSFTDANTDGTFEATFGDLSAGEYSLTILAPSGVSATYDVSLPVDVTLAEGEAQTQAIVVTDASWGGSGLGASDARRGSCAAARTRPAGVSSTA